MEALIFDIQRFENIDNKENQTVVTGTAENDSISNYYYSYVTIYGNAGNDTIDSGAFGESSSVYANNVRIYGGDGEDSIKSRGSGTRIDGGADNDYIYSVGSRVSIFGGDGDDDIYSHGSNVSINAGAGNDKIENSSSTSRITINAGDGNDSVYIAEFCSNVTINTGAGDDSIEVFSPSTIKAGSGNDYIQAYGNEMVYQYNAGDGNDIIFGFSNGTLIIDGASYATTKSGNHLFIGVGEGKIILNDAADKNPIIQGTLNPQGRVDTKLPFDNIILYTHNTENIKFVEGTAYADSIDNNGSIVTIVGGDGNDTIYNQGSYVTIYGGAGDDSINNATDDVVVFVYESGNDTISGFTENDTLNFAANYTGWTTDNNDLIINAAEGSVRITDVKGQWIKLADAEGNFIANIHLASSSEDIIDGRNYEGYEVINGSDNISNQIYAGASGSSLWGGNGGNDELHGNSGYDEFVYTYGSGQDSIFSASFEDVVNLNGVAFDQISSAQINDNGVNATFTDSGSLNISGQIGTFLLGGQSFGADYQNKTWFVK